MATLYRLANLKLETLKPCQRNQIFKQILRAKTKRKFGDKMRLESYSILCRFDPSRFSFLVLVLPHIKNAVHNARNLNLNM